MGLRVLLAITSQTIPMPGSTKTYTSGCARNQNRCCHSNGLPPPLTSTSCPPTTKPVGKKKLVSSTRSINWRMPAASSGGNASSSRKAVMNWTQTKNGKRSQVIPGARMLMMVTRKFTAPSNDDVISSTMPINQ